MNARRILCIAACAAGLAVAAAWAAEDVFAFIPSGGRTLLARVLQPRTPAEEVRSLLSAKRSREEWVAYLRGRGAQLPELRKLGDKELQTLADYLAFNLPLPAARIPADPARAAWDKLLPMDGRDMTLEYCQGCHIVTVVVTQDRTKEAWLGSMNKPSHVQIKLSPPQREALASYLVLNAAIPIDQVPEALRAGGATY